MEEINVYQTDGYQVDDASEWTSFKVPEAPSSPFKKQKLEVSEESSLKKSISFGQLQKRIKEGLFC